MCLPRQGCADVFPFSMNYATRMYTKTSNYYVIKPAFSSARIDDLLQADVFSTIQSTPSVIIGFYAPAYSKNSGRALSVTPVRPVRPSVRPSVRPYVPLSCPGHNSKTLWNIFMKLHRCIHHNKTMCHEQGRQLSHFWFLNYFPLT